MKRYAHSIIALLCILSACGHKVNQDVFTKDAFPLKVGNYWRYQVVDFLGGGGETDTLTLSVVSLRTQNNTKTYHCNLLRSNGTIIDSGNFKMSDTAISYAGSDPRYSIWGFFNLKLPFHLNQKWQGLFPGDTLWSEAVVHSYPVNSITYPTLYVLIRRTYVPQYTLLQQLEIAPGIGVVSESVNIRSDTATWQNEGLTLIDYKLN